MSATRQNFLALIRNKIVMRRAFVGPCGLNPPHNHPRADEINYAVNGNFDSGFIQENEGR